MKVLLIFALVLVLSNASLVFADWSNPVSDPSIEFCASITDCNNCTTNGNYSCFWCDQPLNSSKSFCHSFALFTPEVLSVCPRLTSGNDSCSCSAGFWPCSDKVSGQLVLTIFYGITLAYGATLMADGSELLLEVIDPGVIGGLLLPLLGVVPDAAIILVSGATGTQAQAQKQLNVGVGTLAGSTIMLLTIPWSIALFLGRCDIRNGVSVDKTLTNRFSLLGSGATMDQHVLTTSKIMMLTSVSYFIVQGIAFHYLRDPTPNESMEKWFALAGAIVCFTFLILYSIFQAYYSNNDKDDSLELKETFEEMEYEKLLVTLGKPDSSTDSDEENASNDGDDESEPLDKKKTIAKALFLMVAGTFLVSAFSDPMVGVLSDFADTVGINAFYISFVITPLCSNASETVSSLMFAAKKLKKNSGLVFSQLYGAAIMNNTICLGIFYSLVVIRGLRWQFSAETLSILLVILVVGIIAATQNTLKLFWSFLVVLLYPISLGFVYLLENAVGWQ